MSSAADLLALWYAALASAAGIVVETDDPERLRQKLYQVRAAAADQSLADLSLVISPLNPDSQVFIVKRNPNG